MSVLQNIAPDVQQVAEAIAIAIGVEVEIVDNELTVIGGTSFYAKRIGEKEEAGRVDGDYLYARVLRSGVTEAVADAPNYQDYGVPEVNGKIRELAEICTPIRDGDCTIGIIGLVAMNEKQRAVLLDRKRRMVVFVEKMADLLAAKAAQTVTLNESASMIGEITAVLETTHEGILAIDQRGYIFRCNSLAQSLLRTTGQDLLGSHLSRHMMGAPALNVLHSGIGYTENEEVYVTDRGKFHFIITAKPIQKNDAITGVVLSFRDIEEAQKLAYRINNRTLKYTFNDIIGNSQAVLRAKNQALLTARGNSTVLITGESGTGKEMFAKAIHYAGARSRKPFVTVNCGAIPENLLESELFGYEKGAFTGASDKGKIGKFEAADGGTIFLDEVGDMPLHLQVKLLHVLQNMRFERVGGNKTIIVDVRVIAATNRDLETMIREGRFREDLYYRLSVIPLIIPPLRERKEDIRQLMEFFLRKYNTFMSKNIVGFARDVEQLYFEYAWPGNVRELENAVEYGVNMAFGNQIDRDAVPARLLKDFAEPVDAAGEGLTLGERVRRYEREIILGKLKQFGTGGAGKEQAARELGMSRATLYRKLVELEIK